MSGATKVGEAIAKKGATSVVGALATEVAGSFGKLALLPVTLVNAYIAGEHEAATESLRAASKCVCWQSVPMDFTPGSLRGLTFVQARRRGVAIWFSGFWHYHSQSNLDVKRFAVGHNVFRFNAKTGYISEYKEMPQEGCRTCAKE